MIWSILRWLKYLCNYCVVWKERERAKSMLKQPWKEVGTTHVSAMHCKTIVGSLHSIINYWIIRSDRKGYGLHAVWQKPTNNGHVMTVTIFYRITYCFSIVIELLTMQRTIFRSYFPFKHSLIFRNGLKIHSIAFFPTKTRITLLHLWQPTSE